MQLTIQTPEDALAASKESLEAISSDVGFIPNMAVGGKPMLEGVLAPTLDGGACPHLTVLLKTASQLYPVLASFYALGAKRNGWMAHRSIAGEAELDRERLSAAGLDVEALESDGRLAVVEFDPDEKPDASPEPWQKALEDALGRGLSALWYSRHAVGPDERLYDGVVAFEVAWHHAFKNKPVVTLCPYLVGGLSGSGAIERMQERLQVSRRPAHPKPRRRLHAFPGRAMILSLTDRLSVGSRCPSHQRKKAAFGKRPRQDRRFFIRPRAADRP